MARRKGVARHGWLVLDKPLGLSSTQALARCRWLLGAAKAGHGGTLDPLATGILPLAFGEATKLVARIVEGSKAYRFTLRFGLATSTDDAEGPVTAESPARPDDRAIEAAFTGFLGDIRQRPPAFSAIKRDGVRAYERARAGATVELAERPVRIDRLALVARPDADHAVIEVTCGKGTYVRSLARDLAERLGTVGHVAALRRTRVGRLDESMTISLETLEAIGDMEARSERLLPLLTALDDIPALAVGGDAAQRLRSGQAVVIGGMSAPASVRTCESIDHVDEVVCVTGSTPVAIARIDRGLLVPVRVFNLS